VTLVLDKELEMYTPAGVRSVTIIMEDNLNELSTTPLTDARGFAMLAESEKYTTVNRLGATPDANSETIDNK
jgi:hypothetical protein